eukprot:TRINITY_DN111532_c0_g1_i1.p1 TRINITY_DN111532_c0_g1~~TRINITY_DN111532_c0_g1_i1.p1  ORF type:complete len:390 (+),score=66.20 TRINITY_DN111532_c0_g1_i1:59-1171(+)
MTQPHNRHLPSHLIQRLGCAVVLAASGIANYAAAEALDRPEVARLFVEKQFLGRDPMLASIPEKELAMEPQEGMTHVSARDIDMVLELAPQPLTFWLELGAFEGGSAIRTAQRIALAKKTKETSVIAVDTFLGDVRVLWEASDEDKRTYLRPDGTVSLYDRFRANVRKAGVSSTVLPLPATSVVGLRLADSLAQQGLAPRPQVIYLDSAHEEGEVLLECRLAWQALAPGGILFGDDWHLTEAKAGHKEFVHDGGAVQRDVLRFATEMEGQLDDDFGRIAQPLRTLGRPRKGLFVSYNSFQWFIRKPWNATDQVITQSGQDAASSSYDCWSDGYGPADCCDKGKFGPQGNEGCWDLVFTYDRCCKGAFSNL